MTLKKVSNNAPPQGNFNWGNDNGPNRSSEGTSGLAATHTGPGMDSARTEKAHEEYLRLAYNVSRGYENLGEKVQAMHSSLRGQSRLLGSKALFKLASTVSTALERLFRLESGQLSNKYGSKAPQLHQLAVASSAASNMARACEGLEGQIDILGGRLELTKTEQDALLQQLKKVHTTVQEFRGAIARFDANTEQICTEHTALTRMADDILTSVLIHARCIDQFARLPDRGLILQGRIPTLDSVQESAQRYLKGEEILEQVGEQDRAAIASVYKLDALREGEKSVTPQQQQQIERLEKILRDILIQVWKPDYVSEGTTLQKALNKNPRLAAWLDERGKSLADIDRLCEGMKQGRFPDGTALDQLEEQVSRLTSADLRPEPTQTLSFHSDEQLTPGKVAGENPLFYRDEPAREQGVKQSLNAFIGGPVVRTEDLVDAYRENLIDDVLSEIVTMKPYEVEAMMKAEGIGDDDFTDEAIGKLINKGYRYLAEEIQTRRENRLESWNPEQAIVQGNMMELGVAALNNKRDALALPEADYMKYTWEAPQQAITDFVGAAQNVVDRFIVRSGNDCVAFRQAENGKWYLIDSTNARQQEQTPLEFVQQRLQLQNKIFQLGVADISLLNEGLGINIGEKMGLDTPRFEFVLFPSDVEPQLGNPLPAGAELV